MPEDKKPAEPAKPAPAQTTVTAEPSKGPDWNFAISKLSQAREYFEKYAGQKGHNPYFALEEISRLEKEVANSDARNATTFDQIKALKLEPPVV